MINTTSNTSSSLTTSPSYIPIQNISHLIPIKSSKDNYILWKSLWTPVLESFELESFVQDDAEVLPKVITAINTAGVSVPSMNLDYLTWCKKDQQLLIWLNATISESLLFDVVGSPSSHALWTTLGNRFSAISRSHFLQLKSRLQTIK